MFMQNFFSRKNSEISYFVTFSRKSYFFLAKTCLTMKTKVNFCFPQLQSHEVLMLIICARPAESGIYHTQHTLSENRGGIHHCSLVMSKHTLLEKLALISYDIPLVHLYTDL